MSPNPDTLTRDRAVARVADWLRLLVVPRQVTELRALKVRRHGRGRPHTEAGFFDADHLADMARAALDLTDRAAGVYLTLNPLPPDLLARRSNRTDWAEGGELSKDADVTARRWLLIDADPVRDPHVSATEPEKANAHAAAEAVRAFLRAEGWPEPIMADSGNGFHLLYRIDLPAEDGGLVKAALEALARRFDTPAVKIDRAVHNPSRIVKVPGTVARKGDPTRDRPHRRSEFLDVPGELVPVARELLVRLVAAVRASAPPPADNRPHPDDAPPVTYRSRLDIDRWLGDRGVPFRVKAEPDARGRTVYVLGACPFDPAHADPDACVMQAADGRLSAHCFHSGCAGRGWAAFKDAIGPPEPHHYDPPLSHARRARAGRSASPGGDLPPADDRPQHATSPGGTRPTVTIDPTAPVLDAMAAVTDILAAGGECFHRAGQLVRITAGTITPVLSAPNSPASSTTTARF